MDSLIEPVEQSAVVRVTVEAKEQIGLGTKDDSSNPCICPWDCKTEHHVTDKVDQSAEVSNAISLDTRGAVDQESEIYGCVTCCWKINKNSQASPHGPLHNTDTSLLQKVHLVPERPELAWNQTDFTLKLQYFSGSKLEKNIRFRKGVWYSHSPQVHKTETSSWLKSFNIQFHQWNYDVVCCILKSALQTRMQTPVWSIPCNSWADLEGREVRGVQSNLLDYKKTETL